LIIDRVCISHHLHVIALNILAKLSTGRSSANTSKLLFARAINFCV
jgi:hypothetical protein